MVDIQWEAPPARGNSRQSLFEQYRSPLTQRAKRIKDPDKWRGRIFEYERAATAGTRATDLRKKYGDEFEFASRTTETGGAVWARVTPPAST